MAILLLPRKWRNPDPVWLFQIAYGKLSNQFVKWLMALNVTLNCLWKRLTKQFAQSWSNVVWMHFTCNNLVTRSKNVHWNWVHWSIFITEVIYPILSVQIGWGIFLAEMFLSEVVAILYVYIFVSNIRLLLAKDQLCQCVDLWTPHLVWRNY